MQQLENLKKEKPFLICVDSDGCAMDTMDIKHKKCFGPSMIEEWNLQQWEEKILSRWYEINLYSNLRGINRFKGLVMALKEIDTKYVRIEGLDGFIQWVEGTKELSNNSLKKQIENGDTNSIICMEKALQWSINLNLKIQNLTDDEKIPFANVKEALERAHQFADVAIVSSANYEAVYEEWSKNGLLDYVNLLLAQNIGTKAYCISELKKKGYEASHILMVGDAPGDEIAADENKVFFYPILVKHEADSWKEFIEHAFEKFLKKDFDDCAFLYRNQFHKNLK